MGRATGIRDDEVDAILMGEDDHPWSAEDRDVLALADQMTTTPPQVDPRIVERLRLSIGDAAVVGLTAAIAFENYRARFNRAMDIPALGYDQAPSRAV